MKTKLIPLLSASLAILGAGATHATLTVTNGGFGTSNQNGGIVAGGGWFESGTANWVEGTWTSGANANPDDGGDTFLLLMDGGSASIGWLYQSLGTITQEEIDFGTLQITADFAEKNDGSTNTAVFDFYVGAFPGAATGTDIEANLTSQLTITVDAAGQGLTAARGNASRQNGVSVGTFDISGLTAGDEVWIRITESRITDPSNPDPGSTLQGDLMIDNLAASVPYPPVDQWFWDIDGATPGAGGATPAGTWDAATANWTESADGDTATSAWTDGLKAIFAAGTDADGIYTVTVSGTREAVAVSVEEGDVTLSGGGLDLVGGADIEVADLTSLTVETPLVGTAGLSTSGLGTVVLSGTNTYSGDTVLGGNVEIEGGSVLPDTEALEVAGSLLLFADETVGPLSGGGSVDIDTFTLTLGGAADSSFGGTIIGLGNLVKTGAATLTMTGTPSDIDGTLTIEEGTVALATNNYMRALGNAAGIVVEDTATLRIDSTNVLHVDGGTDFTPVTVNIGGTVELNANHNHFGPLALNGGTVTGIRGAAYRGEYTTFDDTVTVAGTRQSVITDTTGLSYALNGPAIEFNVASTGDASGIDLDFQSPLINAEAIGGDGLVKTGPGTMSFSGINSYTGDTTVEGGVLRVNGDSLADEASLTIDGGVVEPTGTEIVSALFFGAAQQAVGTWGATDSGADNIDDTHFAGSAGVVLVEALGYDAWAGGFVGFNDTAPELDFENDGLASGIEWVVGGDPTANDAAGVTPTFDNTTNPDDFLFTYRRTLDALDDPNTTIEVEYGSDLSGWTTAEDGVDGVTITEDIDGAGTDIDLIEVAIPRALATGGKLFARLKVTVAP